MTNLCCQVRFFYKDFVGVLSTLYWSLDNPWGEGCHRMCLYSCKYFCNIYVIDFLAVASEGVFCTVIMCHWGRFLDSHIYIAPSLSSRLAYWHVNKIIMNNLMFCPQLSKRYLGARHGERREKNNNFPYLSARESRAFSSLIRLIKLNEIIAIANLENQLYSVTHTYILHSLSSRGLFKEKTMNMNENILNWNLTS